MSADATPSSARPARDFDARRRRARRLMYGRWWYLKPCLWPYERRVLWPAAIATRSALTVHNAMLRRMIAELDRALAERQDDA